MLNTIAADILELPAGIVSAHVSHNKVAFGALPALIASVYQSLESVGEPQPEPAGRPIS